jgi:hypothetical protein
MRSYRFWYIKGTSRPYGSITAEKHDEFYKKLFEFLRKEGGTLCPGTITYQETEAVPDPPTYLERESFTAEEREVANRIGTPLQDRTVI